MDFAGFCDEAVRAFLLRAGMPYFFVLLYAAGGLLRSGARRPGGFPGGTYHAVGMNFGKVRESVMTVMELDALKDVDVRTVEKEGLVDIREIPVERGLTAEERLRDFIGKVKNPYCFRVGDVVVKTAFSENGGSFGERFERMLAGLK